MIPLISIIVPVLNEAALLAEFLQSLRCLGDDLEIIVVDGGSSDGSGKIAATFADRTVTAPRGRGSQMNAGAALARGEILWFLHADLRVQENAIEKIEAACADSRLAGGCFRLRYPRSEWIYRISDSLGNAGVDVFGFALGDHGIFCRRSSFQQARGYPEVPILEDAEIYRRLRGEGRMLQLRAEIISDPRTFEGHGRYRTTAVYFSILALYVLGVPIRILNRIYRRFRGIGGSNAPRVPSESGAAAQSTGLAGWRPRPRGRWAGAEKSRQTPPFSSASPGPPRATRKAG
jgi:rSAM/selenodomain-associated transferase 2